MTAPRISPPFRYLAAMPSEAAVAFLVVNPGSADEERIPFCRALAIGRDEPGRDLIPGQLLIGDPTISRRHCFLDRSTDGRCYVRDVSRNGTRVGGRRILPNVETQIHHGETLAVGNHEFVLDARGTPGERRHSTSGRVTATGSLETIATVLVGDIRDFTVLVRQVPSSILQRQVARVFELLNGAVVERGGTVKEYPGDAVVAFWEQNDQDNCAAAACRGALALNALGQGIGADPAVWELRDSPLVLDWALATGLVTVSSFGGRHPQGLSVIGEPVVLAFRLEKLAGPETGSILACNQTRLLAGDEFAFRDLGEVMLQGFDRPHHVHSLQERRPSLD